MLQVLTLRRCILVLNQSLCAHSGRWSLTAEGPSTVPDGGSSRYHPGLVSALILVIIATANCVVVARVGYKNVACKL
jgi:hypothetical protein